MQVQNANGNSRWTAGVNKFADYSPQELAQLRGWRGGAAPAAGAYSLAQVTSEELPSDVAWTNLTTTRRIRNQGPCGSCWAIASALVMEAHYEIHNGEARSFSTQQLLSCVQNQQHCGGKGGCSGATVELALDYMSRHSMSLDEEVPYTAADQMCGQPQMELAQEPVQDAELMVRLVMPGVHQVQQPHLTRGFVGWERLPENRYEPLRRAVALRGPVAISVAASDWALYLSGIFDTCSRDAVIDHAVTLVGYGEQGKGDKYWLIQNSWGRDWGEEGRIRLLRSDDDDARCGVDRQPQLGTGCDAGPSEVAVCGMCGLLYDSVVPHFDRNL